MSRYASSEVPAPRGKGVPENVAWTESYDRETGASGGVGTMRDGTHVVFRREATGAYDVVQTHPDGSITTIQVSCTGARRQYTTPPPSSPTSTSDATDTQEPYASLCATTETNDRGDRSHNARAHGSVIVAGNGCCVAVGDSNIMYGVSFGGLAWGLTVGIVRAVRVPVRWAWWIASSGARALWAASASLVAAHSSRRAERDAFGYAIYRGTPGDGRRHHDDDDDDDDIDRGRHADGEAPNAWPTIDVDGLYYASAYRPDVFDRTVEKQGFEHDYRVALGVLDALGPGRQGILIAPLYGLALGTHESRRRPAAEAFRDVARSTPADARHLILERARAPPDHEDGHCFRIHCLEGVEDVPSDARRRLWTRDAVAKAIALLASRGPLALRYVSFDKRRCLGTIVAVKPCDAWSRHCWAESLPDALEAHLAGTEDEDDDFYLGDHDWATPFHAGEPARLLAMARGLCRLASLGLESCEYDRSCKLAQFANELSALLAGDAVVLARWALDPRLPHDAGLVESWIDAEWIRATARVRRVDRLMRVAARIQATIDPARTRRDTKDGTDDVPRQEEACH